MNAKTHFLSGVVAGYLVDPTWKGALIGGLAAMLPDIDEPKSFIGRLVPFLSVPMRAFVSHRTLTHSLLFVIAAGAIFSSIDQAIAIACMAGLVAHIIGDLLTGRVQLFWPFKLWVGLPVPRIVYVLIDRIAFISLLALILWKGIKPFVKYPGLKSEACRSSGLASRETARRSPTAKD